jgi:hypothetical protein
MRAGVLLSVFCGLLTVACSGRVSHGKVDGIKLASAWTLIEAPSLDDLLSLSVGIRHTASAKAALQVEEFRMLPLLLESSV